MRLSFVDYGSGLYSLVSDKGLGANLNFSPDSGRPLNSVRVGFIAQPSSVDFYVASGDCCETYVFIGQMDRVEDSIETVGITPALMDRKLQSSWLVTMRPVSSSNLRFPSTSSFEQLASF